MTDEKKNQNRSRGTTVTDEAGTGQSFAALTPLEEKVLRMLHGLSEDDSHQLKFALGADEEARAQLALMEKHLLDTFQWGELATFDVDEEHVEAKAKIIDRLRDD